MASMAEVRLGFDGQCRLVYAAYGFVVRADGVRVGQGWGAVGRRLSRSAAALVALEHGLEFVLNSDLARRSLIAMSDAPGAIAAVLGPRIAGSRPQASQNLTDLIGQFDALRFQRADARDNMEAKSLAHLGLARFEVCPRAFEICDDAGLSDYLTGHSSGAASRGEVPAPPATHPFLALPIDPEHLRRILEGLPFRQREMIRLRYSTNGGGYTLSEIGRIFKISRGRVQQILKQSMNRLWRLAARFELWR